MHVMECLFDDGPDIQAPGHTSSTAASPQGSSLNSPALRQQSPPHHSHLTASASPNHRSSTPLGSSSALLMHSQTPPQQPSAPSDVVMSMGLNVQPADQQAQQSGQGQGSSRQPGYTKSRSQYQGGAPHWPPQFMVNPSNRASLSVFNPYDPCIIFCYTCYAQKHECLMFMCFDVQTDLVVQLLVAAGWSKITCRSDGVDLS